MSVIPIKTRMGRPRRVTLEHIVGAACEIGLDKIDMASVAKKVGIGVATLYGYVEDRDHLLRLVAFKLAGENIARDHGQSWEDAVRDYAEMSYGIYMSYPGLINQHIAGIAGNPSDSPAANSILALLLARGIEAADAMALSAQVIQAVTGAAVAATCFLRLTRDVGGEELARRKLKAACEEHDYQALRRCIDGADFYDMAGDYRPVMECLIDRQRAKMVLVGAG